jgi:Rrf2 family iron-sulfur cluster assembly transcriptional regulator
VLFQHASELAIRATLFLAQQPPGKLSPVHEIAVHAGASQPYLAKILQRLTSAGLVRAFRGPGRGMELGRAPEEITLGSVVRALEGLPVPEGCILGETLCSEQNPCPLHERWVSLRNEIQRLLDETTVASLARRPCEANLGIGPFHASHSQTASYEGSRRHKNSKTVFKTPRVSARPRKKSQRESELGRDDRFGRGDRL